MPFDINVIGPKNRDYPASLSNKSARVLFPQIWALGDLEILKKPLLGFFCSVKCPGDLILRTYVNGSSFALCLISECSSKYEMKGSIGVTDND